MPFDVTAALKSEKLTPEAFEAALEQIDEAQRHLLTLAQHAEDAKLVALSQELDAASAKIHDNLLVVVRAWEWLDAAEAAPA